MSLLCKNLRIITAASLSLFLLSCSSKIDRTRFNILIEDKIRLNQNSIQGLAYYCGTEGEWNYYYLDLPFTLDKKYKIKKNEDVVTCQNFYTSERSEWIVVYPVSYSKEQIERLPKVNQGKENKDTLFNVFPNK